MSKSIVTQARVKELFDYRDGELFRKVFVRGGSFDMVGKSAGGLSAIGRYVISVDGRRYYRYRLVWLWHHGYLPENGIDHIDRDQTKDRIENLREAGQQCNTRNTGNRCNNSSGVKGVWFIKAENKWVAEIKVNGRKIHLGRSIDFLEAACLRLAGEQAENWAGCDSSSPAYQYVQAHIGNAA